MTHSSRSLLGVLASLATCAVACAGLGACGGGGDENPPPGSSGGTSAFEPTTAPLGNFNVKCDQSPAEQAQQQSTFQQQQIAQCSPQFQFFSSVVTDFDVSLDCPRGRVIVLGKGVDQTSQAIPIQPSGAWEGQVALNQKVENDGHGNVSCKVKTIVHFNGRASCQSGSERLNWATQVDFSEASSNARLAELTDPSIASPSISPSALPEVSSLPENTPSSEAPSMAPSAAPGSASPSPSPSTSATSCSFSQPEKVSASELTITIPPGASDLGCQSFGAGAYEVSAGTSVTWLNEDSAPHTVTSVSGAGDSFDSGVIAPGDSYTHVFRATGSFNYTSSLDPGMKGLVVVTASPAAGVTPSPSASPSPSSTPSVTPRPSVSPSPRPSSSSPPFVPAPSVTQIVSCVVVNPCPIVATTSIQCPVPQQR